LALGETRDPNGRPVKLDQERWNHIIDATSGHREIAPLRAEVLRAVQAPDRRLPGREPNEEWFYLGNVGPTRWIKVVVLYEDGYGRIITAFPRRAFP
jgi:hypothetical protein